MTRTKLSVVLIAVCVVKCLAMTYDELEDFAEYLQKTSKLSPTLKKGVDPDDDYDEEEIVSDHAWEDSGKFEGDLILNERQRRFIVEDVAEGLARNGISDGTKRWPNNEVVYYIQVEHFNSGQVQAIQSGIEDLGRASCVKFRPYKKGDRDAVVIQGSRRGCFSQVGYQGGYQVLNLSGRHPVGRGCFRHGTVVHELLHTLGFYHMQSSPDRDDYVDIVWANIVQSARHNFRKYNSFAVSDFGVGYDYDSVLHYSRRAFSTNGQDTIVPKQSGAQIGQRVGLSDKDTQKLNKMYCDADSNLFQSEENASKKTDTKKKNARNKPFDGQGIGYHQGKAVAFKILPTAETYKLPDVPSFHVFDYFSKEPQLLSTAENEGFRIGKEMTYSYNPPEHLAIHEDKRLHDFDTHSETKPDHMDMKLHAHAHDNDHIAEMKHVFSQAGKQLSKSNSAVELPKHDSYASSVGEQKLDPYLVDTFDRLSKIIKMHVYPSQTPDLSAYKMNEHFINYYSPSQDKLTETIVSSNPIKTVIVEEDMMYPNTRKHNYKFSESSPDKHRTDSPVNWNKEIYEQKQEHIQNAPVAVTSKNSHYKKYNSFPLNKHFEDKYLTETSFQSPGNYRDKEKLTSVYYPKIHKDDKPNENHDEWHQKYVPQYPGHDYYRTKDSSRKPEYDSKSSEYIFSSSNPSRFQEFSDFHNPTKTMKHWNKIKYTSIENR